MNKRILIAGFYVPGWGGPSLAGYSLFEKLQNDNENVLYLNLVFSKDKTHLTEKFGINSDNPKKLKNVFTSFIDEELQLSFQNKALAKLISDLSPEIIIGITWRVAFIMKKVSPEIPLIFMPSGCESLKKFIRQGKVKSFTDISEKLFDSQLEWLHPDPLEELAAANSDLVVTHSESILKIFRYLFPLSENKIYSEIIWWTEWTINDPEKYQHFNKPFEERDIDLLFISNDWNRPEKNYFMMKEIIEKSKDFNIHIIGFADDLPDGVTYHSFIPDAEKIYELMGKTKVLVSTSLFDASPGILFEGSVMGCNIVASKNCGNWKICNDELLVEKYEPDCFAEKIELALTKKYQDNLGYFLKNNPYQKLKDIISEFKH